MRAAPFLFRFTLGAVLSALPQVINASDNNNNAVDRKATSVTEPVTAEFIGYFTLGARIMFALVDTSDRDSTVRGWAAKGGDIGRIHIEEFDSKSETLFVRLPPGRLLALHLSASHVGTSELPKIGREEAIRSLRAMVDKLASAPNEGPPANLNYDVGLVTENQKLLILQLREEAKRNGGTPIVARKEDGTLFVTVVPPYPEKFIPAVVRQSLTDADMRAFQVELAVASVERGGGPIRMKPGISLPPNQPHK